MAEAQARAHTAADAVLIARDPVCRHPEQPSCQHGPYAAGVKARKVDELGDPDIPVPGALRLTGRLLYGIHYAAAREQC